MKRLVVLLLTICISIAGWCQHTINTGNHRHIFSGGGTSLIAYVCNNNNSASSAINTTGANLIVFAWSDTIAASPVFTDNKSNGSATISPASYTATTPVLRIGYWSNPTVGTGHTFTSTGGTLPGYCVYAFHEGNGLYDAGIAPSPVTCTGTTSCTTNTITPPSGQHLVFTASTIPQNGVIPTVNNGFAIPGGTGYQVGVPGTNYAVGGATLTQNPGSAISATWAGYSSGNAVVSIVSFN